MPKKGREEEEEPKEEEAKEREEAELEVSSRELARLKKELEEKTALADGYLSRLKYLQADFENYKKMAAREREQYEKCATEQLIKRLLPIIDALEAAFTSVEKSDDQSFLKGLELIYLDLLEALGQEGLKPIKAACEKFDPYKHEVTMTVIDDDLPEDTVVEELEKGYMLGTKVLRTSKVAVSKKATPQQPSNQKGSDEEA